MPAFWGRLLFRLLAPSIRKRISGSSRTRVLIFNRDHQILLIKNWLGQQVWTLPGGGVKAGESPAQAAIRELKEETNLDIKIENLKLKADFNYYYQPLKTSWRVTLFSCFLNKDGQVSINSKEIIAADWFSINNLPENIEPVVPKVLSTLNVEADLHS